MDHIQQIGIIHTPFDQVAGTPIQSSRSTHPGTVEVFPAYRSGMEGLADFSHIYLIYQFNRAPKDFDLEVQPFLDDQTHGIFATRFPHRPSQIGLSVVRIVSVSDGAIEFSGADMLDGTPLWDIKPYIPEFDIFEVDKIGWYQNRKYK